MAVKERSRPGVNTRRRNPVAGRLRVVSPGSVRASGYTQPEPELAILSSEKQNLIIALLLGIATLTVYFPLLRYPFINYDDDVYVVKNLHVNTGLKWQNVKWAWSALAAGNWHPLTWLSHQLDWQVFGSFAGGHHLTSVMLHLFNTLLLFWLLRKATGAKWRSAIVAGLFALQPLNVESVAWVAERKNLLCTLFFLLSLGAYGWYARRPQIRRYAVVAGLFALGLASKPMVITLPFVLLLVDFWPLGRIAAWTTPSPAFPVEQRRFSQLLVEKLPLLALSIASAIVTFIAQKTADSVTPIIGWSMSLRLQNAVHSYAMYLWKTFFPLHLALLYPATILPAWRVALAAILLLAVGWLVYWRWRHRPYVVAGCLWFLGILVPVIGIVQVGAQSMADRYTYIPCIGLFVAIVWTVADWAESSSLKRRSAVATAIIVLAVLSLTTARQVRFWKSSYDLWTHTLQVTGTNFVAEENLGNSLVALGRYDDALPHFLNAEGLHPRNATVQLNVGTALLRGGFYPEAVEHFKAVVALSQDPSFLADSYKGLGVASAQIGDRQSARTYFLKALSFAPNDTMNLYNLSLLEAEEGIDKMSRALMTHPSAEGYVQLGQLFEEDHKISSAQDAYRKALQMSPNLAEAKQALLELNAQHE
jgi:protein O-mannosyl-transferase